MHKRDNDLRAVIGGMQLEEKVEQLIGIGNKGGVFGAETAEIFGTAGSEKHGIPPLVMGHAITGVRSGRISRVKATYFSAPVAIGASWDPLLYSRVGTAMALEMRALGQDLNLGPTVNIVRHPLGGRNWESFSEDPYLTARLAVPFVRAMQDGGVICCVKHFAANNQERNRFDINNVIDERTLREIYLPAFRAVIEEARSLSLMAAYNRVNGTFMSEHTGLLRDVLRGEWGFTGFVVSDFFKAIRSTVGAVRGGVNIEMDAPTFYGEPLVKACRDGEVAEEEIDELLFEKLSAMARMGLFDARPPVSKTVVHSEAHQAIALDVARSAPVLLRNESGRLPLDRTPLRSMAVIGPNAAQFASPTKEPGAYSNVLQGGGSGRCYYIPEAMIDPLTGIRAAAQNVDVRHAVGCAPPNGRDHDPQQDEAWLREALDTAAGVDAVVLVVGLSGFMEREGDDRDHDRLPAAQERLIQEVTAVHPDAIVMLVAGSYINVSPWIDGVRTLLFCPYAGERLGQGMAEVLFGDVNPNGRLPFSWPHQAADYPESAIFMGGPWTEEGVDNRYEEGVFVGYRYFDTNARDVLFPFGHGMGYTDFHYGEARRLEHAGQIVVELDVTNIGPRTGHEVVQCYVRDAGSQAPCPLRELKGFTKIQLAAGETQRIRIPLDPNAFNLYDVEQKAWVPASGKHVIEIGASSRDIRLRLG